MKKIWIVLAENFDDNLYYESAEDAEGFVRDQLDMGFKTEVVFADEVTDEQFDFYMATMNELDPTAVRWLSEQNSNECFGVPYFANTTNAEWYQYLHAIRQDQEAEL